MNIKTTQDDMREANDRIQTLVALARDEDREFTDAEKTETEALVARMTALDKKRQRGETFDELLRHVGGMAPPAPKAAVRGPVLDMTRSGNGHVLDPAAAARSLGAQLVETEMYAALRGQRRSGIWQSQPIELQGAVTFNPATLLVPSGTQLLPFLPFPADWGVAGLFAQGTLDGGMIQYLQETAWTNAAAPVAVGIAKPESAKVFALVQQGLVKLAHFISCPDEFLDDVAGLRSFIDAQMENGIIEVLNNQLINGDGAGGDIMGLIALPGRVPDIVAAAPPGGPATAIAAQRAQIYALSRLQPDAVVMNPMTWAGVASTITSSGGFLAGGANADTFGEGVPPQVWGLRVVETPQCPAGTAIVGAFRQGGQLYSKGGVIVQATNSHADYFVKNITAIRAEIRVALVIYRPLAFGLVTGLPAPAVGP